MKTYRVTQEVVNAVAAASLITGGIPQQLPMDDEGLTAFPLSDETIAKLLYLDPNLDVHNPIEFSEMIMAMMHEGVPHSPDDWVTF